MENCPKCESKRVHRSRTRGVLERVRRNLTGKAPFRCPDCGWRGWAFDFGGVNHAPEPGGPGEVAEPDLTAVDRELADGKKV